MKLNVGRHICFLIYEVESINVNVLDTVNNQHNVSRVAETIKMDMQRTLNYFCTREYRRGTGIGLKFASCPSLTNSIDQSMGNYKHDNTLSITFENDDFIIPGLPQRATGVVCCD